MSSYKFSNTAPSLDFKDRDFDLGKLLDNTDKSIPDLNVIKMLNSWDSSDVISVVPTNLSLVVPQYGRNITMGLKAPLRAIQQQRNRVMVGMHEFGDSIDCDSLIAASLGERQVFKTEARRKKPNLAVSILTDMSNSMEGIKAINAATASYGLINALSHIVGISTELLIYGSRGVIQSAKTFDQTASQANFKWPLLGGTHTGTSMITALNRLYARKAEKRVLFVITDGDSNPQSIEQALDIADAMNVHVIPIGIQVQIMHGFEKVKQIQINNAAELPKHFREQLKQFM